MITMAFFSGNPHTPPPSDDHVYAKCSNNVTNDTNEISHVSASCQTDMTANDMDSQQKELSELKERLRHFEDRRSDGHRWAGHPWLGPLTGLVSGRCLHTLYHLANSKKHGCDMLAGTITSAIKKRYWYNLCRWMILKWIKLIEPSDTINTVYGNCNQCQWLVAWQHQAINFIHMKITFFFNYGHIFQGSMWYEHRNSTCIINHINK